MIGVEILNLKKHSRSANALLNSFFGIINRVIGILCPFINRTIIIYVLGLEFAGLNSLFSSVLSVLNLAEMGISTAIVFCLYKPIAENDTQLVCALLNYIRKIYYYIGIVVLIIGLLLIPFIPRLINGELPDDTNVYVLYFIYLFNAIIGYFFYAYKSTILNAAQKIGYINNINTVILLAQGVVQFMILVSLKNYYLYLVCMPFFTLTGNVVVSLVAKKIYPNYYPHGNLPKVEKKDIARRVKGLFISKICNMSRNSFDSIFISSFIGLRTVAIYGNYYYVVAAVYGIIGVFTASMIASVGNSIVTESVKKNYEDFQKINFLFNWIVGFCAVCLLTMFQPFMKLWIGEDGLFPSGMVILMCVYFYFLSISATRAVYHEAAGLWWESRYRTILETILNLILNYVLTTGFGVFGTVLGTLLTLVFVNYLYGSQIVFKYYFIDISSIEYHCNNLKYFIVTTLLGILLYMICTIYEIAPIIQLILNFITCVIIFNSGYCFVFMNTAIFKESISYVKRILILLKK
jgi:Membrane protein involved in the export of O-antigen and teichoic acid